MFSLFRRCEKKNLRNYTRQEVEQFLAVYDEDKFVLLGRIADLSIGGMCVISEVSIPLGNVVKLAIEIPRDNADVETLWVRCESVWQHVDEKNDLCKIGFRFMGVSPDNIKKIQGVIGRQKF